MQKAEMAWQEPGWTLTEIHEDSEPDHKDSAPRNTHNPRNCDGMARSRRGGGENCDGNGATHQAHLWLDLLDLLVLINPKHSTPWASRGMQGRPTSTAGRGGHSASPLQRTAPSHTNHYELEYIGAGGRLPQRGLRIHSARAGLAGPLCPAFVRSFVRNARKVPKRAPKSSKFH